MPSWDFLFLTRLSRWPSPLWQKQSVPLWNYNSGVELLTGSNLSCLLQTRDEAPFFLSSVSLSSPSTRVKLTSEASNLLQKVMAFFSVSTLGRHDPRKPLLAIILWSLEGFLGVLWQSGPLMGLHQAHSDLFKVSKMFEIAFHLDIKMRSLAKRT